MWSYLINRLAFFANTGIYDLLTATSKDETGLQDTLEILNLENFSVLHSSVTML